MEIKLKKFFVLQAFLVSALLFSSRVQALSDPLIVYEVNLIGIPIIFPLEPSLLDNLLPFSLERGVIKLDQVAHNLDSVFEMNNGSRAGIVMAAEGPGASTLKIAGTSGQNQTLNILGNAVISGIMYNVDNLNVASNAQLIVNDTISGLKNLILSQNPINLATILQNVDFIQDPGSTLEVELKDINNFGDMVLKGANNGVTLAPNSIINVADEFKILDFLINPITGQVNLSSQLEVLNSLSTLAPPSNGGMADLAQRMFRKVMFGVLDHLYYVDCTCGPLTSGYRRGVWTRVIGDYVRQGEDQDTLGYHSRSGGVVLGYDGAYRNHSVFGAALSYSMGTVSSHTFADQQQTLNSYQLTAYFNHDHGGDRTGYMDLMGAVAFDRFDNSRDIVAGNFISSAHSAFNGWHYGVDLESGYRISLDRAKKYQLVPLVNVRYSNLGLNDYTETGSDLALNVQTSDIGEFVTGAGFKLRRVNKRLIPELRMNVYYDWIADPQSSTSTFVLGSDPFTTNGAEIEPLLYNVGLSLGGEIKKNLILALSYDADFKSYYLGHTGSIKFKYEW